jgi:nucleoside-diphosphate-sugar epimerase
VGQNGRVGENKVTGKVLITGASGFIGGRLRDALIAEGADAVSIRRDGSPEPKVGRSVVADYADVRGLTRLMAEEKPDYVFHVAGSTKGRTYEDFRLGNVMPTENLLAALREGHPGLERFVLFSSLACFGPSAPGRPLSEDAERRPVEFYGRSKLEAEQLVEAERHLPWTIIRPSGVYGPGDVDYLNLFKTAHLGLNVFFGNRHKWQSCVYVDDLVRATLAAAAHERTVGKGYFICDGRPITWGDFQDHVLRAVGRRTITMNLPGAFVDMAAHFGELATRMDGKPRLFNRQKALLGAQEAWTCTHRRAAEDFGYAPTVAVEEGVPLTFRWYRDQRWL